MTEKTITLRADLVERLQDMASEQGRSVDDVLDALLETQPLPGTSTNWASALAQIMENADIEWRDDPELSARSRDNFKDDLY